MRTMYAYPMLGAAPTTPTMEDMVGMTNGQVTATNTPGGVMTTTGGSTMTVGSKRAKKFVIALGLLTIATAAVGGAIGGKSRVGGAVGAGLGAGLGFFAGGAALSAMMS